SWFHSGTRQPLNCVFRSKPNDDIMFHAMDWFVPGVGAVAVTTGGGVVVPVVGEGEDGEVEPGEPADAFGRVASFGMPTRLRVLAAESSRIICWRSCSSRVAE